MQTNNDFRSLDALEERLRGFARYCETIAPPFAWKFTRQDLNWLLDRIERHASKQPLLEAA